MSDVIISVEGLGKKYAIRHEGQRPRYKTFRETLTQTALSLGTRWSRRNRENAKDATREDFWALRDVSFDLERGKVLGIIGRNGAGKSTLLKILSRITEPSEGRVTLRGRVASLLEVGTGFHPELTGRENIYLNGSILGMAHSEIRRKFDEIVAFAGVEKFLDTPVKRYSSGMYVRLAFAVAAHLEPEILIVDEVLAVGDAEFQKKCLGKMQDVAGHGRTVLFVSHNMAAVEALCHSVNVFDRGRIIYSGSTADSLTFYQTETITSQRLSLADRSDRKGSGQARVLKAYCLGTQNEVTNCINSGDRLKVVFEVRSQQVFNNFVPGLNITDSRGLRVATFWNGFNVNQISLNAGESRLILEIQRLDLRPGEYRLSATLGLDGEALDDVEDILELNILAPQSWQPARYPDIAHGPMFPEFCWSKYA